MNYKQEMNAITLVGIFLTIWGIVSLSIGLADFFLNDKASFWSILYIITGLILLIRFRPIFSYNKYLETKRLEKKIDDEFGK